MDTLPDSDTVTLAPQVLPRMTERFSAWDPLADPAWGTADMAVWRPLLESESQRDAISQVLPVCHVLPRILSCNMLCCATFPVPTMCALQVSSCFLFIWGWRFFLACVWHEALGWQDTYRQCILPAAAATAILLHISATLRLIWMPHDPEQAGCPLHLQVVAFVH